MHCWRNTKSGIKSIKKIVSVFAFLVFVLQKETFERILQYVLIKDFHRFMTNKTKYHGKKHFWRYCLKCFSTSKILENYAKIYLAIYHTKIVTLNEENTYTRFRDFKRLLKTPFTIYAHFEIILKPGTDNKRKWKHTKKYQNHIVCSYGCKLICVDKQYNKP